MYPPCGYPLLGEDYDVYKREKYREMVEIKSEKTSEGALKNSSR
jgi:hypothetical protein